MKAGKDAQLAALKQIYDQGAFLVRAGDNKAPIRKLMRSVILTDENDDPIVTEDANGVALVKTEERIARCDWYDIERHARKDGYILWYAPGRQGLMVLDFDPMIAERLEAIEGVIGQCYRSYESSGKWKEAEGSRPAGKGGHACWRVDPDKAEEASKTRQFSVVPDGESYGEAFTSHPGFGVVVWDAVSMLETMELDAAECVDPTLLPKARYSIARQNADGSWEGGEGSRHDAAMSAIARAALTSGTEQAFEDELASIEKAFMASVGSERDAASEWDRMAQRGWEHYKSDRAADADAKRRVGGLIAPKNLANAEADRSQRRVEAKLNEASEEDASGVPLDPETGGAWLPSDLYDPVGVLLDKLRLKKANVFDNYESALALCSKCDVIVLPGEYRDETLWSAFDVCGYTFRWNLLMQRLELERSGRWHHVSGKGREGAWIRGGVNEITRRCAVIKQIMDKGKPTDTYCISRIVHSKAWGKNAGDFYAAIMGCIPAGLIEEVNPLAVWVEQKLQAWYVLPAEEKDRLIASLDQVFLGLPGIKVPEGPHTRLAAFCGRYLFTMLGHRSLQSHPEYADRKIKPQRNVPVMAGEPGTGKSSVMRSMAPTDTPLEVAYAELDIEKEPDEIKRLIAGRMIGLFDDLDTIAGAYGGRHKGRVKSLITMPQMDFRWMRENPVSVKNPCVFVGTANELNLPNDDGTQVRFVPFLVESDRLDGESGNDAWKRAEAYIAANIDGWVMAGLHLAVMDESFELDAQGLIDQRVALGDVAADPGEMKTIITRMIGSGIYRLDNGTPAIAPYQVAHWLGWLKAPYNIGEGIGPGGATISRGDAIVRGKTPINDTALYAAFQGDRERRKWEHDIREGMRKVGWHYVRSGVKVGEGAEQVICYTYRPMEGGVMPPETTARKTDNVVPMRPPTSIPKPPIEPQIPSARHRSDDIDEVDRDFEDIGLGDEIG